MSVRETLLSAAILQFRCCHCHSELQMNVPIDLTRLNCTSCGRRIAPVSWSAGHPVNHKHMQRLIRLCYLRKGFARKVMEATRRDYLRGVTSEWGLSKSLLGTHSAQALASWGHRSWWLPLLLPLAASIPLADGTILPPVGAIVLILLNARSIGRSKAIADRYFSDDSYDPSWFDSKRIGATRQLRDQLDVREPKDLVFASQHDPFSVFGATISSWMMLVDRRRAASGEMHRQAVRLGLDEAEQRLIASISDDPDLNRDHEHILVGRVTFVQSHRVEGYPTAFFDKDGFPLTAVSNGEEADEHDSTGCARAYAYIQYHNPARDLITTTLLRLRNRGAFTYAEFVRCEMLPLAKRVFRNFELPPTKAELRARFARPRWWFSLSAATRLRVQFVLGMLIVVTVAWIAGASAAHDAIFWNDDYGSAYFLANIHLIILTIMLIFTFGVRTKFDDIYTRGTRWPFPISLLSKSDQVRRDKLHELRMLQRMGEFDYSAPNPAIRVAQAKEFEQHYIDRIENNILYKSQDMALQEAFLRCLDDAGIDTRDYREGVAQLNNFGVINTGNIGGGVNQGERTHSPDKASPSTKSEEKRA